MIGQYNIGIPIIIQTRATTTGHSSMMNGTEKSTKQQVKGIHTVKAFFFSITGFNIPGHQFLWIL